MQKNLISLMLLVAAVTSATLDPTNIMEETEPEEFPINYRVDSRMRRQVSSTDAKPDSAISTDVPVIDGSTLLTNLASVQKSTTAINQGTTSIALPVDPSLLSLNSCIFIGLKISIIINISSPLSCSKICSSDPNCTHFTHEALKSGGTCTLHKAPGLGNEWSTPVARSSGATCGHVPKQNCVSGDGSLININLCLKLALQISLGGLRAV